MVPVVLTGLASSRRSVATRTVPGPASGYKLFNLVQRAAGTGSTQGPANGGRVLRVGRHAHGMGRAGRLLAGSAGRRGRAGGHRAGAIKLAYVVTLTPGRYDDVVGDLDRVATDI